MSCKFLAILHGAYGKNRTNVHKNSLSTTLYLPHDDKHPLQRILTTLLARDSNVIVYLRNKHENIKPPGPTRVESTSYPDLIIEWMAIGSPISIVFPAINYISWTDQGCVFPFNSAMTN